MVGYLLFLLTVTALVAPALANVHDEHGEVLSEPFRAAQQATMVVTYSNLHGKANTITIPAVAAAGPRAEFWSNEHCGGKLCGALYLNGCADATIIIAGSISSSALLTRFGGETWVAFFDSPGCRGTVLTKQNLSLGCFNMDGVFNGCTFRTEEGRGWD